MAKIFLNFDAGNQVSKCRHVDSQCFEKIPETGKNVPLLAARNAGIARSNHFQIQGHRETVRLVLYR